MTDEPELPAIDRVERMVEAMRRQGEYGAQDLGLIEAVESVLRLAKRTPDGDVVELLRDKREWAEQHDGWAEIDIEQIDQITAALEAAAPDVGEDTARLDWLQRESDDLRCFSIPTGGGDADVGWRVIGHYMADPQERVIAEVFHDSVRDAIDAAMAALKEHGAYSDKFAALTASTEGEE